jgi:uncharacterized protein YbaR (Trm112 family)
MSIGHLNKSLTKKVKELEKTAFSKCTVEKLKFILICPKCKKKLFIFKTPPTLGVVVHARDLRPYLSEIAKPIEHQNAICHYCKSKLIFDKKFVIME